MKTAAITSLAAIVAATTPSAAATTASAPADRPNVLFIAFDDLRLNLGCYGDPVAKTPAIDRLAKQGTLFGRAYCQQAVCNPSRQSLLSGRRPDSIRVWDLKALFRTTAPDVVPLPEHFKLNGYFTQSIGKIYHGVTGMNDPQSWSLPEEFGDVPKRDDYRLEQNRQPTRGMKAAAAECADAPDSAYPDGQVALAAVAALEKLAAREASAQPFFLAVGIRKPHAPFAAPKRFWDLYDPAKLPPVECPAPPKGAPEIALHNSIEMRGYSDIPRTGDIPAATISRIRHGYYATTSFADAQLGLVLDALERTGLAKNTIIIVWSDHGYHLGKHGLWCKTTNYEADTRVPLIIITPDARLRGVRTDALVELLDLYPTLIELCGLPAREKLDGRSLAANLGNPSAPGRNAARSQFPRPWVTNRTYEPEYMGYAARTASHRYIEWRKFGTTEIVARELYNYTGDQLFETENIAKRPENAALVRSMSALVAQ